MPATKSSTPVSSGSDSNPRRRKEPKYRHHKASGQAVVTLNGKDHYLGRFDTQESKIRYGRLIQQWWESPENFQPVIERDSGTDLTVIELTNMYLAWAERHYRKDGQPTSEIHNVLRALRALRECYAALPARAFSPLKLKQTRDKLVADGLSRKNCNRYTGIITRVFAFGVENELIPADTWHALKSVKGLQPGRTPAHECEPVKPVDEVTIEATLPHLAEPYRSMVRIQELIACRPGELVRMTSDQIDRSRKAWLYEPRHHKTEHKGKKRTIPIGPRAQLLLQPLLPAFDSMQIFRTNEGHPISPGAYKSMIARACKKAGVPRWGPNRLRHNGATRISQELDLTAAQVILGHSSKATTQIYAELDVNKAIEVALKIG
jgi:integrase